MNAGNAPQPPKNLALYATLQSLTLVVCWIIFVTLGTFALMNYDLSDVGCWLLLAIACMAVYGLRPNLERAIDTVWLSDVKNQEALTERVAQLRPIKRRIDIFFSVGVIVLFLSGAILWAILISLNIITVTA